MSPQFNLSDYIEVKDRVQAFRKDHPDWGLLAKILVDDGQRIVIEATVYDESQRPVARGHAEEIRGQGMVNKTSALENAETSAWGRALANLGLHVSRSIASREEMHRVERRQTAGGASGSNAPTPARATPGTSQANSRKEGPPTNESVRSTEDEHNLEPGTAQTGEGAGPNSDRAVENAQRRHFKRLIAELRDDDARAWLQFKNQHKLPQNPDNWSDSEVQAAREFFAGASV